MAAAGKRSKELAQRLLDVVSGGATLTEASDNFTWTADPDAIIEKVRRGKQALESIH